MKNIKNLTSLSSLVPTNVPVAGLVTAPVRTALATPASNILSAFLWLTLLCASAPQTFAQSGIPLWTNRYDGPANSGDTVQAMAVDSSGNVFVTGYSLDVYGYGDYATVGYSGTGVPLWTNRYDGPGNSDDYPDSAAVDSNGNVFVTGSSYGVISAQDYATVKYSGAGVPLWTNRYNGPVNGGDSASAMAVDGNGNVFVTGYSDGGGSSSDYATIKYSSAGVALWTNRYDGPGHGSDFASTMAVDSSGNVFVTGSSYGGTNADYDYATIKYSSVGLPLWTNRYNGPGNGSDFVSAMAVDSSGNVFVTGSSYGGTNTDYDYATIKYSSAGVALWTNRYNGPVSGSDYAFAMAVDSSGNVFVTGSSYGGTNTDYDYATIKYSSAGVALWTNRYNGPGSPSDSASAMAVDGSGNVFVTGSSYGGTNIYDDYATIKYSSAGVALWTNRYDGGTTATAMAVDSSGNVFVTGGASDDDYVTIKYSSSLTRPSLTIRRTGSTTVAVSWPASASNFVLQQNTNSLSSINWSNITSGISNDGTTKTLVVNPASGVRFYRLVSP